MLTRIDAAAMDAETVQMISIIDEEKDAHIIITVEGLIQFANKGVTNVYILGLHMIDACQYSVYMKPVTTRAAACVVTASVLVTMQ